jgi:hypothetical protein
VKPPDPEKTSWRFSPVGFGWVLLATTCPDAIVEVDGMSKLALNPGGGAATGLTTPAKRKAMNANTPIIATTKAIAFGRSSDFI